MSPDLKKKIYTYSQNFRIMMLLHETVRDYMSITSFVCMTKGKELQKRIINEDLSCTGQEKNVQ